MSKSNFLILIVLFISTIKAEINLKSFQKTKFEVKKGSPVKFVYDISENTQIIGIYFDIANIYSTNVKILKSPNELIMNYSLGDYQYKEIPVKDLGNKIYIEIEENDFYYTDYISIYNPNEKISLEKNQVVTMYNFVNDSKYEFDYDIKGNAILFFNGINLLEKSDIKIYINKQNYSLESNNLYFKYNFSQKGPVNISIERVSNNTNKITEITIVIHDYNNETFGANELIPNENNIINYIYSNETQTFYYYVNITEQKMNTINFKLNHQYYGKNDAINFYSKFSNEINSDIIILDNYQKINDNYITYDNGSDQYIRYYFDNSNHKFLLIKLSILDKEKYPGENNLIVSITNKIEEKIITDYNKLEKYSITLINNIPIYFTLNVNSNDKYILGQNERDIITIIKGDLIENDKINNNLVNVSNDLVILNEGKYTIKYFGTTEGNIIYYIEKVKNENIVIKENERNNYIYEIQCNGEETKYALGTFNYNNYLYGKGENVRYYVTPESNDYEIYFKNNTNSLSDNLFPSSDLEKIEKNKIINLNNSVDLFTIKCQNKFNLAIRVEMKKFKEDVFIINQNNISNIEPNKDIIILQLTTPLGITNKKLYFSILSLSQSRITIKPDTIGLFDKAKITTEPFYLSIDLNNYAMDQLALIVTECNKKKIEIIELIHDDGENCKLLNNGTNIISNFNQASFAINNSIHNISINFEKFEENEKIKYKFIHSAINDMNYIASIDSYNNTPSTFVFQKDNNMNLFLECKNSNQNDIKKYQFLLLSFENKTNERIIKIEINYEKKIEPPTSQPETDSPTLPSSNIDKLIHFLIIGLLVGLIIFIILIFTIIRLCKIRKEKKLRETLENLFEENKKGKEIVEENLMPLVN